MAYRLEFEIPGLPKLLNGSVGHWSQVAKERKAWRSASCLIAKSKRPLTPLRKAKLTLTRCSTTKPDVDNLAASFKGVIDGLKDAGVIWDDRDDVIVERLYLHEKAPQRKGKIKVLVESVE